mgnify:FL=1
MSTSHTTRRGFTIVELLIVVIVIAILASIAVFSYGSIRQQANAARTAHAASTYNRALLTYHVLHGAYPAITSGGGVCLGTGYTDRNSDGIGDCGETAWPVREDVGFNTQLKTLISSTPLANDSLVKMPYQTSTWAGATFHYFPPNPLNPNPGDIDGLTVNGVSKPYYIMYVTEGANATCAVSELVIPDESQYGWPKMTSDVPAGRTWSWSDGNTTACVGTLPNPS